MIFKMVYREGREPVRVGIVHAVMKIFVLV